MKGSVLRSQCFRYGALLALLACAPLGARVHAAFIVPIAAHSPQVIVSMTTQRDPDDVNWIIINSTIISESHTMPLGSAPHYEVATWDTGAPVHVLSREAYDSFDLAGAGKNGAFATPVNGVDAIASDPLGIYVGGFGSVTQTTPNLMANTNSFVGQYNASVLYAPPGESLPTLVGSPLLSQYTSVFDYANPQILTVDGQQYRSPGVTIAEFDDLPDPSRRIQMEVVAGVLGDPPTFFTSLTNLDDFGDDPSAPTVGPSFFLDATISHNGVTQTGLDMIYDTGSQGSFVSEQVAATLGFDVANDEPDFIVRLQTVSGTVDEVPGFFVDQFELPGTDGGLVRGLTPLIVFNLPDPRSIGNVLDGLIGQNVLADRTVTFDPEPALGLGEPPPFLGLSDPSLDNHDWASATASAPFGDSASWTNPEAPQFDWIAHVENNAAFDQTAIVTADASVSALNVVGDSERMTVSIDDGVELTVFGTVIVTDNGELNLAGGSVDPLAVEIRGGSLTGHGDVGGEVISRALIAPGDSTGVLHFLGNVDLLSQNVLAMQIGGTDNSTAGAEQYDQVAIDGTAGLAGTLQLSLIDGFVPSPSDTFELIGYGQGFGSFDTIEGLEIEPGRSFSLLYNETGVLAIAGQWVAGAEELTGVFDVPEELLVSGDWTWDGLLVKRGDGALALDLDGGFSTTPNAALAIVDGTVRFEGNGILELSGMTFGDLGVLSGDTTLAGVSGWYATPSAVPEPGTAALAVIGLLVVALTRRRRRTPCN